MQLLPKSNRTLWILTAVNYLNYIDRYILAASLVAIKAELQLSDLQAGLLATAFILAYVVTTPLFGWLGDRLARPKLLALGVLVWSLATMATGLAQSFVLIMSARMILGVGESAFTTISPAFLCEHFNTTKRGWVLSVFSSAIPVGSALGYILGGLISQYWGWRNAFFVATVPGVILAVTIAGFPEIRTSKPAVGYSLRSVLSGLLKNKIYVWAVLGYCAYTFTLGGLANWMPSYLQRYFALDAGRANTIFGAMAVVSGLTGTMLGGWLGDYCLRRTELPVHRVHLRMSGIAVLLAVPTVYGCFATHSIGTFIVCMSVTQLLLFISTSPINVVLLEVVPMGFRTSGIALAIFFIHILGDAVSAPLIGQVSDATGSLAKGVSVCLPALAVCGIFWLMGASRRPVHAGDLQISQS